MSDPNSSLAAVDPAQAFMAGLVDLGVSPTVAQGAIGYATRNESSGNPWAVNPDSGATGYMQWLGSRKQALQDKYGPSPTVEQQVQHMKDELQGSESATLERLKGASDAPDPASAGYAIWGQSYERPGPLALAKAGLGGPSVRPTTGFSLPTAGLGGVPPDFGQVRANALAALQTPPPEEGVPAAGELPTGSGSGMDSPWQRLMTLSMISKLQAQGTHQFQLIEYDPFKVASSTQVTRIGGRGG